MAVNPESKPINIAVVGGGIGGLCVTIALLKQPHIKVQIYEAAHKFSEIGAGVAFGPNAQRALKIIGPEAEQAYLRQATNNMGKDMQYVWGEIRFGQGPRSEELITAPMNETGQSTVHRAKFLEEFVSLVPKDICHFGKRLQKIEDHGSEGVKLHFNDGTTATADAMIGADGIHSPTRSFLLGADHPATNAMFTHSVAYRGLVPMDEAVAAIGERYAQNTFVFPGKGGMVMIYPIDFGKIMNIVAINSEHETWEGPWVQHAEYEKVSADFANWGPLVRKIIKLLDRPETAAWSMWDHPPAPTFTKGRVVMMGDAAHATTPFQGQGAGQAIEDACVLQHVLSVVRDPAQLGAAFQGYDRIRRPRALKVVTTSRETGELMALRLPSVMDDAAALKENMDWRFDWLWHRDVKLECEQAGLVYDLLLKGETLP